MISLEINPDFEAKIDPASLRQTCQIVLEKLTSGMAEVTIVISDDGTIQELNRTYREIDAPTDVLSFPADFTDPESSAPYLGDIIISYPRAQTQAEQSGHPTQAELQLLTIHGLLHLLGYDHGTPEEKQTMWALQQGFLDQLGLGEIRITE